MVKRRFLAIVFTGALLFLPSARADWQILSLENRGGAEDTFLYRHYSLGEAASGLNGELDLVSFSAKKANLRVIDQPKLTSDLAAVMTRDKCLAGVNGGYFDPQGAPVGLLRSNGKEISPWRKARLLSGVLAVDAKGVRLFRAGAFPRKHAWREAVQCGPFLVDHGKAVAGLDNERSARRTFVATTSDEQVLLGYCEPLTLAQLAQMIASLSALQIEHAMNLDGGSSSAFWCRAKVGTISIPERKQVRDFLGLLPASSR
jgi:uncharacterized protein YigE (DUF2233 family)